MSRHHSSEGGWRPHAHREPRLQLGLVAAGAVVVCAVLMGLLKAWPASYVVAVDMMVAGVLFLAGLLVWYLVGRVDRSERWFRTLFDEGPEAKLVYRFEREGTGPVVAANAAALSRYGYTLDELGEVGVAGLFAGEPAEVASDLRRIGTEGHVLLNATHRSREGREFPVEISATLSEIEGEPMVLASIRDVSERVAAERALRESEARYRATFDNAAVGIAYASPSGVFVHVNERVCDILGYTRDELLGRTFQEITHPDDLQDSMERAKALLGGGCTSYVIEKRYLHREGHIVWVNVNVSLLTDPSGTRRFVGVIDDITHKKEAEAGLRESEERFRQIADNLDVVLWMFDARARRLLYVSPAWEEVIGTSRDAVYEAPDAWLAHVHEEDVEQVRETYACTIETKTTVEFRILRPDGDVRYMRSIAFPIRDAAGAPYRTAGFTSDITDSIQYREERSARELAEDALRVKTAILHGVSDELRTPLTAILGFAEALRDGVAPEEQQEYVQVIERSAKQLEEAIASLLAMAQLDSGALLITPRALDFEFEVREAVRILQPLALSKGLEVITTTPEREVLGRSDSSVLSRILYVLIGNGIRFTEYGGVYVHLEASVTDVEIRVRDTGDGINLAMLPDLFEGLGGPRPFNDGLGVSLALVQRLVHTLGGTIDVESALREGTTFTVRLPRLMSMRPLPPVRAVEAVL